MGTTHASNIIGNILTQVGAPTDPPPKVGDEYYDTAQHAWFRYNGTTWLGANFTTSSTSTTTSTSTSTSTSTTTTSTSSSTTTSTSTSTTTTG